MSGAFLMEVAAALLSWNLLLSAGENTVRVGDGLSTQASKRASHRKHISDLYCLAK